MKLGSLEDVTALRRFRTVALVVSGMMAVVTAQAGPIITISGTWGSYTSGGGVISTAFDNGAAFSFSTRVSSFSPTFFNSGETQLPTVGGSYTNGAVTRPLSVLEQLVLTDPSAWNGQDFGFGVHDVFVTGDFMAIFFNGPQLFSGPTNAPGVPGGSFVGTEAWYGYSGEYLAPGSTDYSYAHLEGNATITVRSASVDFRTPEPSTGLLMALAFVLGAVYVGLVARTKRSRE